MNNFTRRHYILLAQAIREAKERAFDYYGYNSEESEEMVRGIDTVESLLIGICAKDNVRFNLKKWEQATKI